MKKNIFIAFEGIDGTGKTTHSASLEHVLADKGFEVFYYHKIPSKGGWLLDGIAYEENRKNTRELFGDYAVSLVEAIDRINTLNSYVAPLLKNKEKNIAIVAEKFNYGYLAKDSQRLSEKEYELIKRIYEKSVKPDLIIYLKLESKQALERINQRGYGYENIGVLDNYKKAYERLDAYKEFKIVDTYYSKEEVDKVIENIVCNLINRTTVD